MKMTRTMILLTALAVGLAARPLWAAMIAEVEPNNTIATAQNIDGSFTLDFSSAIGNRNFNTSTLIPHVTINGTGDDTLDYYSFTVANAGDIGIFDIDYVGFDSFLRLYTSGGGLLDFNDDGSPYYGQGGSTTGYDSYLEYTFAAPGTYAIEVGKFPAGSPVPSGNFYQLQISVGTPVPLTLPPLFTKQLSIANDDPFPAATPGSHAHSEPGQPVEVGSYEDFEEVRGVIEINLAEQLPGSATLTFSVAQIGSSYNGQSGPGNYTIDVVAYAGDNDITLSDFEASPLATLGSFNTAGLTVGQTLSFDATAAYLALLPSGSLGIRLQPATDPGCHIANQFSSFQLEIVSVPEPSAILLLSGSALALAAWRSNRRPRRGQADFAPKTAPNEPVPLIVPVSALTPLTPSRKSSDS